MHDELNTMYFNWMTYKLRMLQYGYTDWMTLITSLWWKWKYEKSITHAVPVHVKAPNTLLIWTSLHTYTGVSIYLHVKCTCLTWRSWCWTWLYETFWEVMQNLHPSKKNDLLTWKLFDVRVFLFQSSALRELNECGKVYQLNCSPVSEHLCSTGKKIYLNMYS